MDMKNVREAPGSCLSLTRRLVAALAIGVLMFGTSAPAQAPDLFIGGNEGENPNVPAKLAYIRLVEPDMTKAVEFWTKGVGMKVTKRKSPEPGEVVLQFEEDITQTSPSVGLILVPGARTRQGNGRGERLGGDRLRDESHYRDGKKLAKMVIAVADMDRIIRRARFRDLEVQDVTDQHAYISEPGRGNMVELISLSDLPDKPTVPSRQRVSHAKVLTTNWHEAGDFYGNVLGMTEIGSFLHPQRVREMAYGYYNGPPWRKSSVGVTISRYMWDYQETIEAADRDIAARFFLQIHGDPAELARKLATIPGAGPQKIGRPGGAVFVTDPGGNIVEVVKARAPPS